MAKDRTPPEPPPAGRAASAMPSRLGATLNDVAAIAGVSTMTVSRALNRPQQVSAETLARVRSAVAKTGYVPNALAGGLRGARTRLVAALIPSLRNPIYDTTIQALNEELVAHGYQLLLGQTDHLPEREDELLRAIVGRRPDGIVVTGVVHSRTSRSLLLACGVPVVETTDWTDTPIDMLVGFSHDRMGYDACRFLAGKGRRRLALITSANPRALKRADAFRLATQDLGLPPPRLDILPGLADHAGGRAALVRLLDGEPFDAVYCSTDFVALGVLTEARARGIDVPGALAVLGSGDLDFAASVVPSLSTVKVDLDRIGRLAARLVIARSEGGAVDAAPVDVGYAIVERDSA